MNCEVEVRHLRKCWRNGDLEDEMVTEEIKRFPTLMAAKAYIKDKSQKVYDGKDFYYGIRWTGVKWTNENTGEELEEQYQYILRRKYNSKNVIIKKK